MEKTMMDEKPMRIFQCYCMFYGEVPTYKSQEEYFDIYLKSQSMMTFLDSFGYSLLYSGEEEPLKRWYMPNRYFTFGEIMVSPELDATIGVMNDSLQGKTLKEIEEHYQESISKESFYDEEITSRIGALVREFSSSSEMDLTEVLRKLTTPKSFKDRVEFFDYEEELMEYAKEAFLPITVTTKEYSVNDPRYLEFLRKYLRKPNSEGNKVKQIEKGRY